MHLLPSLILLTAWTASATAADPRAAAIAPYIDDQTVAVGWVDPARVDLDALEALARHAAKVLATPRQSDAADEVAAAKAMIKTWLDEFKKAGGKDLYAVASLADIPPSDKPFIVAPLGPDANVQVISALLFSGKPDGPTSRTEFSSGDPYPYVTVEKVGSAVVIGSRQTFARLRELKPTARPEIAAAFAAAGDAPACIALVPTADNRRVIEEMIPALPSEIGGGPVTAITHGFSWMSLGIGTKDRVSVKLTIQSQDAAAAKALSAVIDKGLKFLSENKELRELNLDGQRLATLLKPTLRDDRLTLDLAGDTMRDIVENVLVPPLAKARARARRMVSMANASGIMKAVYDYASKHKDQWPPDLDTLVAEKLLTPAVLVNPSDPERKPAYIYIRPSEPISKVPGNSMVVYEAYDKWDEGIYVAYADGSVKFTTDEAKFKELLAEAMAKGTITGTTTQSGTPSNPSNP